MRNKRLNNLERLQTLEYNSSCFYSTVRYTLLCSRVIGLLPVSGLWSSTSEKLRFNLKCPYTLIYLTSMLGQCLMSVMSFYWLLQNGLSLSNITNFIFYTSSLISSILLLNIGRFFSVMVKNVNAIEFSLPPFKNDVTRYSKLTMVFIFAFAFVEHILSLFYGVTVAYFCDKDNVLPTFFRFNMPWIFDYTPYTLWKGILVELFSIQSTFMWSFNDLLLMNISIYLTEHFVVHYEQLEKAVTQQIFSAEVFRLQYLKIVRLVKLINGQTGIYILNSFGSNLYWICTQLFYTLKEFISFAATWYFVDKYFSKNQTGHFIACNNDIVSNSQARYGIEHSIYFIFSFSFLVFRTMMVLLLAARIHSNSIKPLLLLYGLPSEKFDIEVERFISQIKNIKVALSGLDFFFVTRTMILTLVGTIVTYELVMLQLN